MKLGVFVARKSRKTKAIEAINKYGALLVFPVKNQQQPHSLWAELFPKKEMRWEWTDDGDDNVFVLWALMKELSSSTDVVYSKWYQNRATFFSRELFLHLLAWSQHHLNQRLSPSAQNILEELESNSPLSTREVKAATGLQGKFLEAEYSRSLRELFHRFLIVGFGEVEDGAFPSLALGATRLIHEDLWEESKSISLKQAESYIEKTLASGEKFKTFLDKSKSKMAKK